MSQIMGKRAREPEELESSSTKRGRVGPSSRLLELSDELLLRILSSLSVPTLALCQSLCRRLEGIAGDSQLWKAAYYDRFVRPRASRIPGIKESGAPRASLFYSSRTSKWLDEEGLVQRGRDVNWKGQYKLRHNWARGRCDVSEIAVAPAVSTPPLLVQLYEGTIVTADARAGLRAWNARGRHELMASTDLVEVGETSRSAVVPTSLALDGDGGGYGSEEVGVAVGFSNGSFRLYGLNVGRPMFHHRCTHAPHARSPLAAIAYHEKYVATLTERPLLSLYRFPSGPDRHLAGDGGRWEAPALSCSLRSQTVWPPLSLSLRRRFGDVVVSIAYALPTVSSGWTVGIQEVQVTADGEIAGSRLASAIKPGFVPFSAPASARSCPLASGWTGPRRGLRSSSGPTSVCYTHPYLLATHPDNTLTLYLVTSAADRLEISAGSRLWGHTSSVVGAYVDRRGRAVSVSGRGRELRVWELEGGVLSAGGGGGGGRRRRATGAVSVPVRVEAGMDGEAAAEEDVPDVPDVARPASSDGGPRTAEQEAVGDGARWNGWIGFDEEQVVLLQPKELSQALVIYDFT
ncbi:MAG: hypothetical protein M1826_002658 [Phylliscum demangeonii]|nr:MAG: hypothetical protein M1826_002658 [Phylliscum demangeonii]